MKIQTFMMSHPVTINLRRQKCPRKMPYLRTLNLYRKPEMKLQQDFKFSYLKRMQKYEINACFLWKFRWILRTWPSSFNWQIQTFHFCRHRQSAVVGNDSAILGNLPGNVSRKLFVCIKYQKTVCTSNQTWAACLNLEPKFRQNFRQEVKFKKFRLGI